MSVITFFIFLDTEFLFTENCASTLKVALTVLFNGLLTNRMFEKFHAEKSCLYQF